MYLIHVSDISLSIEDDNWDYLSIQLTMQHAHQTLQISFQNKNTLYTGLDDIQRYSPNFSTDYTKTESIPSQTINPAPYTSWRWTSM